MDWLDWVAKIWAINPATVSLRTGRLIDHATATLSVHSTVPVNLATKQTLYTPFLPFSIFFPYVMF